jgi:hypothetical protein
MQHEAGDGQALAAASNRTTAGSSSSSSNSTAGVCLLPQAAPPSTQEAAGGEPALPAVHGGPQRHHQPAGLHMGDSSSWAAGLLLGGLWGSEAATALLPSAGSGAAAVLAVQLAALDWQWGSLLAASANLAWQAALKLLSAVVASRLLVAML